MPLSVRQRPAEPRTLRIHQYATYCTKAITTLELRDEIKVTMNSLNHKPDAALEILHDRFIICLDGPSASGKSTFKTLLLKDESFNLSYVPRYTTRSERQDDITTKDYIFIGQDEFKKIIASGGMIEYRHFLFGMSYGIGLDVLMQEARGSQELLCLLNLGNIQDFKRMLPSSICVLIDAPIKALERRLRERALNTEDQIEERLNNARFASTLYESYDYICQNNDSHLDVSYSHLRDYLLNQREYFNLKRN